MSFPSPPSPVAPFSPPTTQVTTTPSSASTPSAIPATPSSWTLPPSVRSVDPVLHAQVAERIENLRLISPTQRRTLAACVSHFRCIDHVRRMLDLAPAEMGMLANILLAGLHDARPSSSSLASSTHSSFHERAKQHMGAIAAALGPRSFVTTRRSIFTEDRRHGRSRQAELCYDRQAGHCLITFREKANQCTHILPPELGAHVVPNTSLFWFFITVVFGPELRDSLWYLIGGKESYATSNAILLDSSLHKLYDDGEFWLRPVADNRPSHVDYYDLRFEWIAAPLELRRLTTSLPFGPANHLDVDETGSEVIPPRSIQDGECFRLYTPDSRKLPLPPPILFNWRIELRIMITKVGNSSTHGRGQEVKTL